MMTPTRGACDAGARRSLGSDGVSSVEKGYTPVRGITAGIEGQDWRVVSMGAGFVGVYLRDSCIRSITTYIKSISEYTV